MLGTASVNNSINYKPKQILLVEDNRVSRLVTERLLKRWGYAVSLATNGLEGLKMAALNVFDLVLMNMSMPSLSGREASVLIRRLGTHYQAVPIIALSANMVQLRQPQEPFTDFLSIPYMPEQLKNLLQYYLAQAERTSERPRIRARLEDLSGQDAVYKKQLVSLFAKNCQELLEDLHNGNLEDALYLEQVRHKHRGSLRLLELYSLEAALDNMQEMLEQKPLNPALLMQRKLAVAQQAAAVLDELNLLPV